MGANTLGFAAMRLNPTYRPRANLRPTFDAHAMREWDMVIKNPSR